MLTMIQEVFGVRGDLGFGDCSSSSSEQFEKNGVASVSLEFGKRIMTFTFIIQRKNHVKIIQFRSKLNNKSLSLDGNGCAYYKEEQKNLFLLEETLLKCYC